MEARPLQSSLTWPAPTGGTISDQSWRATATGLWLMTRSSGELATSLTVQLTGHIAHHVTIQDQDGAVRNAAALRQALHILDGDIAD
jgi:hypothetical protein